MEIAGLRRDNQIIAQLRAENQRLAGFKVDADELEKLRKQHLELLQLRSQAAVFRLREQELAQAQEALRRVQSGAMAQNPAATGAQQPTLGEGLKPASEWTNAGVALVIGGIGFVMKPASEWTNAGLGTPSSAFETWNWARAKGDVNALAGALALDDDARAKAETLLASLPDSVRAKYGSVEQMMAAGQLSTKPIVGACVSSEDTMGDNDKVIRTQWQNDSGELGASDWRMHRFDDGWRVVISAGQVDKLERMVKTGRALAGAGQ
jgi:hypothetical protein